MTGLLIALAAIAGFIVGLCVDVLIGRAEEPNPRMTHEQEPK